MWVIAWIFLSGSGTSWINTYVGLGFKGNMLTDGDCVTQYMLSLYWVLATLTTNALIMGMYPTTWLEVGSHPTENATAIVDCRM